MGFIFQQNNGLEIFLNLKDNKNERIQNLFTQFLYTAKRNKH